MNLPMRIVALNGTAEQLAAAAMVRGDWPTDEVALTYVAGKKL